MIFKFLLLIQFFFSFPAFSQKVYDKAIVYSLVEVKAGSENGQTISETDSKVILENQKLKVFAKSETSESISYINKTENKAFFITQLMGNKIGFISPVTDKSNIDSFEIIYIDSSKTINGFSCKYAEIVYKKINERRKNAHIWYSDNYKFTDSTMGVNISGIEKLIGFPIQIQTIIPQGYLINYIVSKIDINPKIDKGEFIIPKDYIIFSTMQEFQNRIKELSTGIR